MGFETQAKGILKADAKAKISKRLEGKSGGPFEGSNFPEIIGQRLKLNKHKAALQLARRRIVAKKLGTNKIRRQINRAEKKPKRKNKQSERKFNVSTKKDE